MKSWKREVALATAAPWLAMMARCLWADAATVASLTPLITGLAVPMTGLLGGVFCFHAWRADKSGEG